MTTFHLSDHLALIFCAFPACLIIAGYLTCPLAIKTRLPNKMCSTISRLVQNHTKTAYSVVESWVPWYAGYTSLMICRMVVGLGEASFVSLASPLIGMHYMPNVMPDDNAGHLQDCLRECEARVQCPARTCPSIPMVGM